MFRGRKALKGIFAQTFWLNETVDDGEGGGGAATKNSLIFEAFVGGDYSREKQMQVMSERRKIKAEKEQRAQAALLMNDTQAGPRRLQRDNLPATIRTSFERDMCVWEMITLCKTASITHATVSAVAAPSGRKGKGNQKADDRASDRSSAASSSKSDKGGEAKGSKSCTSQKGTGLN